MTKLDVHALLYGSSKSTHMLECATVLQELANMSTISTRFWNFPPISHGEKRGKSQKIDGFTFDEFCNHS